MSDDKKSDGKTRIITELKDQPPGAQANTDNVGTYIAGVASEPAVGRMFIVEGPSAGTSKPVYPGTNSIGRDPDQNRIALDVEDSYVSRTAHAILSVDAGARRMTILDGGKPNRVLLNGSPLGAEQAIGPNDLVQIGRTTVRFELG